MAEPHPAPWTVLRLLNWTKAHFARAQLPSPRLAAEVLLAHVLGCRRIDLYTRYGYQPTPEQLDAFRELVRRAAAREPVAYLVGHKEFYSLRFQVTPNVLVPRPETEILVDRAIEQLAGAAPRPGGRPRRMWDVCTGCGCVAVAVASRVSEVEVLATDISPAAVAVAERNARAHALADRVRCRRADLLTLPDDCSAWAEVDVITANPPYVAAGAEVAEEVRREPPEALYAGAGGLDCIRPVVAEAPRYLARGGALVLEFGWDQADAVRELIIGGGAFEEPAIYRDQQEIERAAVAVRR
jgi:release factor glutamine methyltransferase